jgi:hypothetical protein
MEANKVTIGFGSLFKTGFGLFQVHYPCLTHLLNIFLGLMIGAMSKL